MQNNPLVGTYELLSWENRYASGETRFPLGPDAKGMICYSPDGSVFVHIMADERRPHASASLFGGDSEEILQSATTHISYCGTYEVGEDEVVHRVTVSSFPNWIGSEQRRSWEFRDGLLLLTARGVSVGSEKVTACLVWRRAKRHESV